MCISTPATMCIRKPSPLTYIGSNGFNGYAALKTLVIPENVRTIGPNAFFVFEADASKGLKTVLCYAKDVDFVGSTIFTITLSPAAQAVCSTATLALLWKRWCKPAWPYRLQAHKTLMDPGRKIGFPREIPLRIVPMLLRPTSLSRRESLSSLPQALLMQRPALTMQIRWRGRWPRASPTGSARQRLAPMIPAPAGKPSLSCGVLPVRRNLLRRQPL